jgi:hypothetical protein
MGGIELIPIPGDKFQHGFTVVLAEHFFPMPMDSVYGDFKAFRDLPISAAAHEKLHDFFAARGKSDNRRSNRFMGIKRKQEFSSLMHVEYLPEICKVPMYCPIADAQRLRYNFWADSLASAGSKFYALSCLFSAWNPSVYRCQQVKVLLYRQ